MALTLEETRTFSGKLDEYKEAKRRLLEKWASNCNILLTIDAVKDGLPEKLSGVLQQAFTFLQEHGLINFGVALQSPEPPAAAAPPPQPAEAAAEAGPKKPRKADIVSRLYDILRTADFAVVTLKAVRAQLQEELGCDMEPYKKMIKKQVDYFIGHLDERETVEPLPVSEDEEEEEDAKGKKEGKGSKAAAAGKGGKDGKQQDQAKEQPHVVVVGAGLAGLVAATVLKRNGCKVTVLDAQTQPGGRLAKLFPLVSSSAGTAEAGTAGTAETVLADAAVAAFGPVSLRLPLLASPSGVEQDADERPADHPRVERWPAGAIALQTLCRQLDVKPLPLEGSGVQAAGGNSEASGSGAAVKVHRPCLYGGGGTEGGAGTVLARINQDVQDEAERLLVELLAALRKRLDGQEKGGKSSGLSGTRQEAAPPASSAAAPGSLAAELEEELRRLLGPETGGGGVKRPAEAMEAAEPSAAGEDAAADGSDRAAKRSRGEGPAAAEAEVKPAGDAAMDVDPAAPAEAKLPVVEATAGGEEPSKGSDGDPQPPSPSQTKSGGDAPSGRHVRQDVLRVLRNHLFPLLELHLGAALSKVSLGQLRLLPPSLPPGMLGRPLRESPPPPASAPAAQEPPTSGAVDAPAPLGLLPVTAARRIVEALAGGLDIRTGVVVTGVSVLAGGVKVSTDSAGTIKAAAALLAVPHTALQSGAITMDPPPQSYRTEAAARVGGGAAVSMSLRLPPGNDLSALCGGGGVLRPFLVSGIAAGVPNKGAAEAAPQATSAPGFLFCPAGPAGEAAGGSATATPGSKSDGELLLVAHVVTSGASAKSALELSDSDLQRHAVSALQAAAGAAAAGDAVADGKSGGLQPLEPISCQITRWGVASGAAAVAAGGRTSNRVEAAAARVGACAHLAAPRGDPRDMTLLAGPVKGRVFFAGEHTAPEQLPYGLLSALAGSGLREAARVLKALKGSTASGAAGKGAAAAGAALEVGDEAPLQKLIAAAEAEARAEAEAAAAARKAAEAAKAKAKAGSKDDEGRKAATEKPKAKGRKAQVVESESEEPEQAESEEDGDEDAGAAKRRGQDVAKQGRTKNKDVKAAGRAAKDKGKKGDKNREEETEALEDADSEKSEEIEDADLEDKSAEGEEEEDDGMGKKKGKAAGGKARKLVKSAGKAKRRKEEQEEELEDEEEDLEDEDGDAEAEDAKKDKKQGKKERKKRKRDRGSGSDSEGGDDDDEDGGEGGKRGKGGRRSEREKAKEKERKEDPVLMGILDKQRRQQALAKLQDERKDVKVVYKAMMAASNGNLGPLREQISSCTGLDAKLVMLQALQKSSLPVLQLLANDGPILTWLRDWLLELCDDSSAEHLALMELRLLERLPLSADALAAALAAAVEEPAPDSTQGESGTGAGGTSSGGAHPVQLLLAAVRERCATHRSKDVKRMAAQVVTSWERRAATLAGVSGRGAVGPTGSSDRPNAPPRVSVFNPKSLVALRSTPPPPLVAVTGVATATTGSSGRPPAGPSSGSQPLRAPPPPPPSQRPTGSGSEGATGARLTPPPGGQGSSEVASGSGGPVGGGGSTADVAGAPPTQRLDPDLEQKLLAAKAAAEAARQEAALAAQRRAEVLQEAQAAGGGRGTLLPEIATFEDFKRVERGGGSSNGSGSGRHKDGGGGAGGGGNSGSKHKSSGGSGGSSLDELKAAVVDHIKQLLKKHHKAGKISSSDFRVIQEKASNKVFETLTESSAAHSHGHDGRRDLLGSKRREKISHLVEQYVQKVAGQRSTAGGASAGPGTAAGLPPPPPPPPLPH